jgi:hypothetical protein
VPCEIERPARERRPTGIILGVEDGALAVRWPRRDGTGGIDNDGIAQVEPLVGA